MPFLPQLVQRAQQQPARITLCEAHDPRVLTAAIRAQQEGIAHILLVGNTAQIEHTAITHQLDLSKLHIEDPKHSKHTPELIQRLAQWRAQKGMTKEKAAQAILDPLCFANMLVHCGHADGSVAGAIYNTADVVRSALQLIGKKPTTPIVSSFFLMLLNQPHHPCQQAVIFSDCGLVIDPDCEELAAIAIAAAHSARSLLNVEPRIAMLSFSTAGSASHPTVTKVVEAAKRVKQQLPHIAIDEDIQFDAAIIPTIAAKKLKQSQVNGQANVFIFPNLEAGNIGYKIAERLGGVTAIGPLLQGLNKPANDLSRGCDSEAIFYVIAATSLQAQHQEHHEPAYT